MVGVILAVGAHPDDIEIGCGGTLKKDINRGARAYGIILTKGQNGNHSPDCHECHGSAESLGLGEIHILDFKDGYLMNNHEVISALEEFVRKYEPDVIYTHSPHDTHQDHVVASAVTLAAARRSNAAKYFYQSPSTTTEFTPTTFSVITETIEDKINALRKYTSQLTRDSVLDIDWVRAEAIYWGHKTVNGSRGRKDFAEAMQLFMEVKR